MCACVHVRVYVHVCLFVSSSPVVMIIGVLLSVAMMEEELESRTEPVFWLVVYLLELLHACIINY